jgi:hypothetical protein
MPRSFCAESQEDKTIGIIAAGIASAIGLPPATSKLTLVPVLALLRLG